LDNFNIANWIRTKPVPLRSPKIKTYQFLEFKFLVVVDAQKLNWLGLRDDYDDEGLCNNYIMGDPTHAQYNEWMRFMPDKRVGLFDKDYDLRLDEKSLNYAVDPKPLSFYQDNMGIGVPGSELWIKNLNANRCKYARVYIPVTWTGEKSPFCHEEEGSDVQRVKNVRVTQKDGIVESCDGSSLSIADTYYLEVIITQETDPDYFYPSQNDQDIAKRKGYILQSYLDSYEYAMNGYNTKVRVWVKPNQIGTSTRALVCRGTPFKKPMKFKVSQD